MSEINHKQDLAELVIRYNHPRPALKNWTTSALKERPRSDVGDVLRDATAQHTGMPEAALFEELAEEAETYGAVGHRERLESSSDADPASAPFGVRTDDPWAGGLSLFSFFESPQARALALLDDFPFLEVAGPDEEPQYAWAPTRATLEELLKRDASAEAINAVTKERYVVAWIGTFDELCLSDHKVAVEVREDLWSHTRDDESAAPISADDRAAFAGFVREHGV